MRPGSLGLRIYRWLLRLLPRDMRLRFGPDMEEVLRMRLSTADGAPVRSALVWLTAVCDVVAQAIVTRIEDREGGGGGVGSLVQDLRQGLRAALADPWLATVAAVTLALGVGASTATFSVVHAVLLRQLPYEEPERLVFVWPEENANKAVMLMAEARMSSLAAVSGMSGWTLTLVGTGEPREVDAQQVSHDHFELLGVRPILGRSFRPDEELPGQGAVVILTYDFWAGAFGADSGVIDRMIDLGGADHDRRRIIGVMPPGVDGIVQDVDVWIPLEGDPARSLSEDDSWYVNHRIARLAPGATLEQANAEVGAYASEIAASLPNVFSAEQAGAATVQPARAYLAREVGTAVRVAFGAVALVLLICCFNVANLLLARGEGRGRDLAVRAALGAGRLRITRLLLTESAVLGVVGGAAGVLLALALIRGMVALAPATFPGIESVSLHPAVLAFALGATALSTLGAGLLPAIRLAGTRATAALGGAARGAGGRSAGRLTPALVGVQITLAVVVTVGSGLMLRSLTMLLAVDPGIDGDGVIAFKPNPPAGRYPDGDAFRRFYEEVVDRVAGLPGVESAGGIHLLPGTSNNWSFPTFPEGYAAPADAPTPSVNFRAIRGDYFETTRIPVVTGRSPGDADGPGREPVVAVNEAFVARFWPGQSAVGKTLSIFSATATRYRVVGVVGDVRQHGREEAPRAEMYFSHGQVPWNQMSLWIVARVRSGDALSAADDVRDAVWSIDADVPVVDVMELTDALGSSTRTARFLTALLGAFGLLALILSAAGVFGVASYSSGRRRPEFGVRLALGSSRSLVVGSAVRRSLAPVAAGLLAGLVVAAASSRLLSSALFGVQPLDAVTFGAVPLVLGAVGVVASVVPAWRASRVDPASVLGSD